MTDVSAYLPALISCLPAAILHVQKQNTLPIILCGAVRCMLLVQLVF
ncbi:MAG: hypothetical protein IJW94_02380 [Oscillospiraceae bacterium]|nr:hypothetical protein [Oscillospiraceae bacterium]